MSTSEPLDLFLPPVRGWFRSAMGEPTPAQREGWPLIRAGQNTLILAPTGSGKTLAAFLACLDGLWRQQTLSSGVQVLYISPLKALNQDIHRNLRVPLEGVAAAAKESGIDLPVIEVAVRTGDTPATERRRLLRQPPHVLITTPESLHLLLTSKARDTLRAVTHCIVDEIHALCGNKRGVFLSLLLERLAALTPRGFVRIGLSATQRPLEEVARFLGGREGTADGRFVPRPVAIVDAGLRKDLDLKVISPVEQFGPQPERSIWPSVYRLLRDEIRQHRSTIIFANNRRSVERITANLNDLGQEESETDLARAHHGSIALEVRHATEQALKEGRLPAVVATASLELGIDMGAVELVCQVESPGNIARGLQRVGRAGHLVGQTSKGRLIPKTQGDLLEQAALAREMLAGHVEEVRVPINCLDVLAQQIVAMTAMEAWDVPALHALIRRAHPYRDLTPQALEAVLEMISGRYRFRPDDAPGVDPAKTLGALQPRVSWDRVHNRLMPLPGSQHLALVSGGTIPDTGQYAAYTRTGVRIGELDEEFIFERRIGDTFSLGTNVWRLEQIETDRVIVAAAEGVPAMMPFWRGEQAGRSADLGMAMGRFLRELSERIDQKDCLAWLEHEFHLDQAAARSLRGYVGRQLARMEALPTDRTITAEAARDPLGDWQVILLCPLGSRLNLGLRLALESILTRRLGYRPQCLHHDDGILIRLSDSAEPVLDLFEGLTPENVEDLILEELADSALFALRFRQNAARALLLPRTKPGKRAPLWLQRLRGRDLLQVARRHADFPLVVETFRECLHDHLDVPRLKQLLADLRDGNVELKARRLDAPSPFASNLLFAFTFAFMYQYDDTEAVSGTAPLDRGLLEQLIAPGEQHHLLDPRAVHQVERRLRGTGRPPRTAPEMAEWLRRVGDVTLAELEAPAPALLQELAGTNMARMIEMPGVGEKERWILAEEESLYRQAFLQNGEDPARARAAAETILTRFLNSHALVSLADVLIRYPFDEAWAAQKLDEWSRQGRLIAVPQNSDLEPVQWSAPASFEQIQRGSLAILRREVISCPPMQFADFVLRWQGMRGTARLGGVEGVLQVLERLQRLPLAAEVWEDAVLPARVPDFQPRWLEEALGRGDWMWSCHCTADEGAGALAFWRRDGLMSHPTPRGAGNAPVLDDCRETVLDTLGRRGASFVSDLAREMGLPPSSIRAALWDLLRRGLVTNDRFEVIRHGQLHPTSAPVRSTSAATIMRGQQRGLSRSRLQPPPEGRWEKIAWGEPHIEALAVTQARLLLNRYGIVARELVLLDRFLLPWRTLYEVLSRMEMAGEVRRGYFVEGMSGAQFALPEAANMLQDGGSPSITAAPVLLLHSLDPANLYGSGAPFDIPLLDGGTRAFTRRGGNWLMLRAGRPVLFVEQQGKRLTAPTSASAGDLTQAARLLPNMLRPLRKGHRKLCVTHWNSEPVRNTPGKEYLEAAGFVRDYQGLVLYAAR